MTDVKIKKGEKVICLLNNRSNLTVGKQYDVLYDVYEGNDWISVINDQGYEFEYNIDRFMSKEKMRIQKINNALK